MSMHVAEQLGLNFPSDPTEELKIKLLAICGQGDWEKFEQIQSDLSPCEYHEIRSRVDQIHKLQLIGDQYQSLLIELKGALKNLLLR